MGEFEELPEEVLRLLRERVGKSLAERPLRLDAPEHRQRLADLLARLGGASFYELLGVDVAASPEEIHAGYEELGRLVHPAHAQRVGLEGRRATLDLLFERATRAYLTLSVPERRKRYDAEMVPFAAERRAEGSAREREQRALAHGYFERAAHLGQTGEEHAAIELLEQAVLIEGRPEYFHLLGDLQSKNRYWLQEAAASYRKALELGASDPVIPVALQAVEERIAAGEDAGGDEPAAGPSRKRAAGDRRPLRAGR
jgi:curved DNA-binding protein CbpA